MALDLEKLKAKNLSRWKAAKLTRAGEFRPVAARLVAAKARYVEVEKLTGVPWFFTAVTHQRESSQRWDRSLAQGDPWNQRSVHIPKGRGPFVSWEAAAVDALVNCHPYAAKNKDWSVGGLLTMLERYNGVGYANKGLPSPYLWSGTDQYQRGKYVRDGVFDANTVDVQLGCAGLILAMQALDPSIKLGGTTKAVELPKASPVSAETGTAGGIAAGGAVAAQQAHANGFRPIIIAWIVLAVIVLAFIGYALAKKAKAPAVADLEPDHGRDNEVIK